MAVQTVDIIELKNSAHEKESDANPKSLDSEGEGLAKDSIHAFLTLQQRSFGLASCTQGVGTNPSVASFRSWWHQYSNH